MKRTIFLLILLAAVAMLAAPVQAQTTADAPSGYYVCKELNCKIVLLDTSVAFLKTPDGVRVGVYDAIDEGKAVLLKIGDSIIVLKVDGDNLVLTMVNFDENNKPETKKFVFVKQADVKNLGDFLSD